MINLKQNKENTDTSSQPVHQKYYNYNYETHSYYEVPFPEHDHYTDKYEDNSWYEDVINDDEQKE